MKKIYTVLLSCILFLTVLVMGRIALAEGGNMVCSCTASACGNNAIGGNQGDIFTGLSSWIVATKFMTNPNTGWTCVEPAKVRGTNGPKGCYCANYCGNGGIGADPNYFDLGLSQERIDQYYGGGAAGNRTGWLCGNSRGTIPDDSDLACSCTASACGNNAIGGDQGDIFSGLTGQTVMDSFKTNPNTGWTCVKPAKVRGADGPKGCYCANYCGNGGIGADPNYFDLGLSQEKVDQNYGGGASGNQTGWLCGNSRGTFSP